MLLEPSPFPRFEYRMQIRILGKPSDGKSLAPVTDRLFRRTRPSG